MRILIAEDEQSTRRMLETMLEKWGYDVIAVKDGHEAWAMLKQENPPPIAILDWMMPGLEGVTVCRKAREIQRDHPPYLILLTGRGEIESIVEGLHGGADDYVTKPFDPEELHARIEVGVRMIRMQITLAEKVSLLEEALVHVKRLQGLLPICSLCKKICDDEKRWQQIEMYIAEHSEAQFSHGLCPDCNEKIMKLQISQLIHPGESMLQPENDRVLKTQEACEYLKISRPTFKQYISRGRIQATRAGHGWRVTKSELDRFLRGKEKNIG
jgi:phosphoserine phosphatase RsbU/P